MSQWTTRSASASSCKPFNMPRCEIRSGAVPLPSSSFMATQGQTPQSGAMPVPSMPAASTRGATSKGPRAAASNEASPTRLQAFHCFARTWQRLRWQLIGFSDSYRRALASSESGFTLQDAELNFKLDFHGFYTLIEQAIVNLLLIFRISLPNRPPSTSRELNESSTLANLLMALDEHSSLRATLGTGNVSRALWTANELGNIWKNPEETEGIPSLRMHNLPWVVVGIMRGLEAAYAAAVKEVETPMGKQRETRHLDCALECVGDPMDWEPAENAL